MSNSERSGTGSVSSEFSWETIRLALQSDKEGIYDWDIESNHIQYSSHCLELLAMDQETGDIPNIFTDWDSVIVDEDRAYFETSLRRYLEGHSDAPFRVETRFRNPHKTSWRWVRITGIARRAPNRQAIRLTGAFVDITRRKTAEAQLEEERHLFRLLIDHIPDNIFFKNRESRFVVANASTAKKLNVPTPSDLIGKTDAHFFDREKAGEWRKEEQRIMYGQTPPIVSSLRRETWKTGEDSWCMATKIPWKGKDNQLKGILGITTDVTSMVQAQMALKRVAAELELKNQAFEKEIRLAREVQLALLPQQVPSTVYSHEGELRQLDFFHKYQPSGGVAGDWFEVFPINERKIGVFICDVMGHGVRSALVASMIRGLLEEAVRENPMPGAFLSLVNVNLSKILARSESTMFATAFYMLIDLKNKVVSYASAGHPAPLYRDSVHNEVRDLESPRGIALGLMEHAVYKDSSLALSDGMGFLLFTDGLIEASNSKGEELGRARVKQCLGQKLLGSAEDSVLKAMKCARDFTGGDSFDDDICLLALKYKEK